MFDLGRWQQMQQVMGIQKDELLTPRGFRRPLSVLSLQQCAPKRIRGKIVHRSA